MASIEYSELTKVFDDGTVAVESFDLSVADGEFVVSSGPPAPARPPSCA